MGLIYLDELRYFFAKKGVEVVVHHTLYHPSRVLPAFRKMIAGSTHALWILVSPSEAAEHWCVEQKVPALLVGSRIEESGLPSVAVDAFAVCRHAVGQMVAQGHRRLAMLVPRNIKGEDHHGRLGFLKAVEESPHRSEIDARVEVHQATKESVCTTLERLLRLAHPPTALLICRQGHYFTAHSYLLQRGIAIPGELSLICRDEAAFFSELLPEPTRYAPDVSRMARTVARMAHRLIGGKLSPNAAEGLVRVVPDFVRGETLGPVPEAGRSFAAGKALL